MPAIKKTAPYKHITMKLLSQIEIPRSPGTVIIQLLQGDLINNQQRAVDALGLINDAIEHSGSSGELASDLQGVQNRLGINQKVLVDAKDEQKQFMAFLEVRQIEIENVDPTESAVKLNDDIRALNISFATLSKVQHLSLVNYL